MTDKTSAEELARKLGVLLPYLRRYARALTASQQTGDHYAAATLEAILTDGAMFAQASSDKVALFQGFHAIWESSGAPIADGETGLKAKVQRHMAGLSEGTREVLLLNTIEEFSVPEIAEIMQITEQEARDRLEIAGREMETMIAGRVLIIEDEAIIAMDLEGIVAEMGHKITGVARTAARAVEMGKAERPDLVLADIHLADGSSGIDAVNELLQHFGDLPVIFVTAYPERLLTGQRPEPAFLISKPYTEEQIRSAVSQAMFFASTETLQA